MLELADGMMLYHGSSVEVPSPDLSKCAPHKDFGRGFYLTSSIDQARSFARIVTRRAMRENVQSSVQRCGYVSRYALNHAESLETRVYPTADAAWLHCVVAHRRGAPFIDVAAALSDVDVIIGKVANDQTNATILAYLAGAYGEIGSARADDICVSLLLPERLDDQACFRTEHSLCCLEYRGSEPIWL